ncbi:putative 2OG-Fe(II) oxygenase [Phenylobacterium sp.]|uniref:putative 2OG-Fe(II) oxygenase n=1 Tax=Phenylobacterium sp. TaxID=1871053 RepID=UPI0035AE5680
MPPADHRQAYELIRQGDVEGALRFTAALLAEPVPSQGAFAARAAALKAAGRKPEALDVNRATLARYPNSAVAWHNLASTLGDLGQAEEAESAARRAVELGLNAPETRLVLARALQAQNRFDEAEAAFRAALDARPAYEEAQTELAQLIWMRTADRRAALARLSRAAAEHPGHPGLSYALAVAQEFTGQPEAARATAEAGLAAAPQDRRLLGLAVELCGKLDDPEAALRWARLGARDDAAGRAVLAQALLAVGDGEGAVAAAARAVALAPLDQYALALLTTAWRLTGDPRYRQTCDYDRLVASYDIVDPDTAEGAGFLEELRAALRRLHRFTTHPFAQSVRQGSQAPLRLDGTHEPVIERLLQMLRETVARRIAELPPGDDAFARRNTGRAEMTGAWSIRLGASGHHADHVHPMGWISSAFYVSTPDDTADAEARSGWIGFGHPGVRTRPELPAERFVQPRPGRLVLFPSYMWHGTVPYASDQERMTVAFDAVPA